MSDSEFFRLKAQRLLGLWGASKKQIDTILNKNDEDEMERCLLIVKIDEYLNIQFNNKENTIGFMSMANENTYFDGRIPLDIISEGDISVLRDVASKVIRL